MIKNNLEDLKFPKDTFNGFFRAVVEDNEDPLQAGRVRARIWGLHTSKKEKDKTEGIPTNELPWAEPVGSLVEGSIGGFGFWSVPLKGSHVFVFFENGNYLEPRYFGTSPGILPEDYEVDTSVGFFDPDGVYPPEHRFGQPDFHRLARGISSDTIIDYKNDNRVTGINMALGGTWNEPFPYYEAEYPHNIVLATHNGLITEWDATPDKVRFHLYHPSNTFIEISKEGSIIIKNNKDKFELVVENNYSWTQMSKTETIGMNNRRLVEGDEYIEIKNDKNIEIGNSNHLKINKDNFESVGAESNLSVGTDFNEVIGRDFSQTIKNNKNTSIVGNENKSIVGSEIKGVTRNVNHTITGSKTTAVGLNVSNTISGNESDIIFGSKTKTVGLNESDTVTGNWTVTVGGNVSIAVAGSCTVASPVVNLTAPVVNLGAAGGMGVARIGDLTTSTTVGDHGSHTHSIALGSTLVFSA